MMTTTGEFDKQISQLESELRALKIRRNASLPVSKLAPEILVKIVTPLDPKVEELVTLCHVAHSWRSVTLGSPELWTTLRITEKSTSQLLDFNMKNVQDQPIYVVMMPSKEYPDKAAIPELRASETIIRILSNTQRLKSLHTITADLGVLAKSTGLAEALRSLVILDVHVGTDDHVTTLPSSLFAEGAPSLTSLTLASHSIPWTSHLLYSSNFTSIILELSPEDENTNLAQLCDVLKRNPNLKVFNIATIPAAGFDHGPDNEDTDQIHPINMPKLEKFTIQGGRLISLSRFLRKIRLPTHMPLLWLECGFRETDIQSSQDIFRRFFMALSSVRGGDHDQKGKYHLNSCR